MAFSVEDEIYMGLYTVGRIPLTTNGTATGQGPTWRRVSHLATGIALADENLGRRPAKFITDPNMARLDKVRAAYDPDGRFHSWMGRDEPSVRQPLRILVVGAGWPAFPLLADYCEKDMTSRLEQRPDTGPWWCGDHLVQWLTVLEHAGRRYGRGRAAAVHRADLDISGRPLVSVDLTTSWTGWRGCSDGPTSSPA